MGTARQNLGYRLAKKTYTGTFDVTANNWGTITDENSFRDFLLSQSGAISVVISNFNLVRRQLTCDLVFETNGFLNLLDFGITKIVSLQNMEGLTYLWLGNNPINNLTGVVLPSTLEYLALYRSMLPTLEGLVFPPNLVVLDLSINQFTTLAQAVFPDNLSVLYLNDNPLNNLAGAVFPITLIEITLYRCFFTTQSYIDSEAWASDLTPFTNPCVMNFAENINSISGTNLEAILLTKNVIPTL